MTVGEHLYELTPARRRRLMARGVLRALATTAVLVALYYLLPLDHVTNVPVTLTAGVLILVAVTVVQMWLIIKARDPGVRAIEALTATVPLFLLLFAWGDFTMAHNNPANFNSHPLTRTDAFSSRITVFTPVGSGDSVRASRSARVVVTLQMVLDLLALGRGVGASGGAFNSASQQAPPAGPPGQTR